jgi:hypothetical protein
MLEIKVAKQDSRQSQQELPLTKPVPDADQPAHLPFIFEYSSAVIAEQLIIIEKDALAEIDWKDLIGLNWHQNPPRVRNWANYLRSSESENGIDLVIARFNIVVKWVVSEIVLTKSRTERARAITKFIHIASHSLRLKNYASTYQITLALLSTDITRRPACRNGSRQPGSRLYPVHRLVHPRPDVQRAEARPYQSDAGDRRSQGP